MGNTFDRRWRSLPFLKGDPPNYALNEKANKHGGFYLMSKRFNHKRVTMQRVRDLSATFYEVIVPELATHGALFMLKLRNYLVI